MDDDDNTNEIYKVCSEGPCFQIPNYEQPPDPDKMFAIDNCGAYLGKVGKDLEEIIKMQEKSKKKTYEKKDIFMREGNKAFRERNYKKALKNYNKAIDLVMDSCVLYTNRAMTYLKLGKPRQALVDATSALYWNPENLKALIYKSQALYMMGDVMESDLTIAKACEIHPGKAGTIKKIQKEWES
ncbi:tetratricopeptide repeat protein 12 isoform X2 [Halyomorpha halys]|uniref:tetratricopeptide repeat protein 12 isoform X2 n=1 Tax=Halyomorpha halys TaxID=286706 RepID=UPI0006D510D4|nr:tetratricopeptide repeat protein 12-like isoform X2 [Halyomorpha halys]